MTDYDRRPEFKALDDTIRAWHTSNDNDEWMLTGWVLLTSAMRVANIPDGASDSYISTSLAASGQSWHHTVGLVTDAKNDLLKPSRGGDE